MGLAGLSAQLRQCRTDGVSPRTRSPKTKSQPKTFCLVVDLPVEWAVMEAILPELGTTSREKAFPLGFCIMTKSIVKTILSLLVTTIHLDSMDLVLSQDPLPNVRRLATRPVGGHMRKTRVSTRDCQCMGCHPGWKPFRRN